MKFLKKNLIIALLSIVNLSCYQMCTLQDASLLPRKKYELMGSYSLIPYYNHHYKESSIVANQIGVHFKYGASNYFNPTFTYVLTMPYFQYVSKIHFLSAGAKFPVIKKHLSFFIPAGIYLCKSNPGLNPFFVQPTLIGTCPLKNIYLNIALSDILFFDTIENSPVITFGVDLKNVFNVFTLRIESGCSTNSKKNGFYYTFNIGLAYSPNKACK